MAASRDDPVDLSLEQELELGEEIQSQLWAQHVAGQQKRQVEALQQELRELCRDNCEQEAENSVHEEKVRQLCENFVKITSFYNRLCAKGTPQTPQQ